MDNEDSIEGTIYTEWAEGTVQCAQCNYWGTMEGFVKPEDSKFIYFVCPTEGCGAIERVTNPFG